MQRRTLLLNGDWDPLGFIDDIRAIKLIVKGKVDIVNVGVGDPVWHDTYAYVNGTMLVPVILRLVKRVTRTIRMSRFSTRTIFRRDGWRCQYCQKVIVGREATIDHVMPKSRGGVTSWTNCVTACHACNRKKMNMTPREAGMVLLTDPHPPSTFISMMEGVSTWHDAWNVFLKRR